MDVKLFLAPVRLRRYRVSIPQGVDVKHGFIVASTDHIGVSIPQGVDVKPYGQRWSCDDADPYQSHKGWTSNKYQHPKLSMTFLRINPTRGGRQTCPNFQLNPLSPRINPTRGGRQTITSSTELRSSWQVSIPQGVDVKLNKAVEMVKASFVSIPQGVDVKQEMYKGTLTPAVVSIPQGVDVKQ